MRQVRAAVAAILILVLSGTVVAGATPSIAVTSVGGQAVKNGQVAQPVSGNVAVTGTATPGGGDAAAGETEPLVADAGDSPFVPSGAKATLIGAAWGGVEPYTFAWTATAGRIVEGGDSATALLDVAGVAPGTYSATLTVRDATGATASDDVKVVVNRITRKVLLDEEKADLMPGASLGVPEAMTFLDFPFEMPAGISSWEVDVTWTLEANDYDLHVIDPNGNEVEEAYSGNGALNLELRYESSGTANPMPGTWTIRMERFLTAADWVRAVVVARVSEPDPRPLVEAGGPYRFEIGTPQSLDGTVTGGTAPVTAAWDLDANGTFETAGTDVAASLPPGHHLVTLKATDGNGFERRQTTSVLVADADRLAQDTTAITVIGIADSGINPYHLDFGAATYPDPDVLATTADFTRHPSEYIKGYPADAPALNITLGQGYYPAADKAVWDDVELGKLYWIPGTKIIGAVDANNSSASNAAADATPILDDDGHGTGSSSVSAGNRYGYCPTCLLFFVEGLDETVATKPEYDFVDITSHSFGYVGGAPVGPVLGPNEVTKAAVERGQTVLFAAGNGIGNAFDVPIPTYGSDQTGASWNITVGAIRRDNQRGVVGDGIPVDISAWGDGNLPSACRTGTVGQCAFGGTSAATPYTAGIFGTVLTEVRRELGDPLAGKRDGQLVAEGSPIDSEMLADGKLTRGELRTAVLKTAFPLNQENELSPFPYPATAPYSGDGNVLFEGYGAATPEGAKRAVDVIMGRAPMPERPFEDQFFELDRAVKDTLYGGYDRDDSVEGPDYQGLAGTSLTPTSVASVEGSLAALKLAAEKLGPALQQQTGEHALELYLHRRFVAEPGKTVDCVADNNESYMDTSNTEGDLECFENRVTSVPAAYRPLGIYAQEGALDAPIPAGSTVHATVYVASETPTVGRATGVLMATDREIGTDVSEVQPILGFGTGTGSNAQGVPLPNGGLCETAGELCWTKFDLSFETERPAFTGEHLTFQIQLLGVRAYAFGHEGGHASRVTILPAPMPESGLEFGVTIQEPADGSTVVSGSEVVAGGRVSFPDLGSDPTGAGDHPTTRRVEVSVDDASFGSPVEAAWDEASGTWHAPLGALADGEHTVYARATMDRTTSEVASSTFTVAPASRVEWQLVARNGAPAADNWRPASGVESWRFAFDTASYGQGTYTLVTRLVEGDLETARSTVRLRMK